ncbi:MULTISPECIES: anti-sigma factor domain-containing protein [unclassified Streptomyces]|uniref:anti-sigma factor domain-containing protein n=1 Tax=unclassified Streptomyces TaxID=2593676 RepID=UPI002E1BA3F1|nr:anti-sigma factor [Streptomyces sp. NBC_01023]
MHSIGRLDATRSVAVQAHLDGCPDCRAELRELRGVAGPLGQADPDRVAEQPPAPPASLRTAIFTEIAKERQPRRRRPKVLMLAAAVIAVCLGAGAVVAQQAASPHGRPVSFTAQPAGVRASATVEGKGWGTMVHLDIAGLPQGKRYMVWLEQPDGSRMPAGSFIAGGPHTMSMQLAVGLPMPDAMALGISTPTDKRPLLRAPLRT